MYEVVVKLGDLILLTLMAGIGIGWILRGLFNVLKKDFESSTEKS